MSLDEDKIRAIENCAQAHEPEPEVRTCFQCKHADAHPHGWKLVVFIGGEHWLCGGCGGDDGEVTDV